MAFSRDSRLGCTGRGWAPESCVEEVRFKCFWNSGSPWWQGDEDFSRQMKKHVQRLDTWFGSPLGVYPSRGKLLRRMSGGRVVSTGVVWGQAEPDTREPQLMPAAPESSTPVSCGLWGTSKFSVPPSSSSQDDSACPCLKHTTKPSCSIIRADRLKCFVHHSAVVDRLIKNVYEQ